MALGKYRRRITLQTGGEVQDPDTGVMTSGWADWRASIPASIEPVSAREFIASSATQARVSTRIEIPYIDGVLPSMRVVDDRGVVYSIEGPPLPDKQSGLHHLTLLCNQGEDAS